MSPRRVVRRVVAATGLLLAAPPAVRAQDVTLDACECLRLSIAEPPRPGPGVPDSVARRAGALSAPPDSLEALGAIATRDRAPGVVPASVLPCVLAALAAAAVLARREVRS